MNYQMIAMAGVRAGVSAGLAMGLYWGYAKAKGRTVDWSKDRGWIVPMLIIMTALSGVIK
jgi:hypothetical protein